MHFSPYIEKANVYDLYGLVTRKVIDNQYVQAGPYKPLPKSPPAPVTSARPSLLDHALSVYNGWIGFDHWLNLPDTTWSKVNKVWRVLHSHSKHSGSFLEMIDYPATDAAAGLLCGKMMSMKAICVLRDIYIKLHDKTYKTSREIFVEAAVFNHFVSLSPYSQGLAYNLFKIGPTCNSLDELEKELFAHYMPVDNLMHARRIFKLRIKNSIMVEWGSVLRNKNLSNEFCLMFLLGILTRLYFLKAAEAVKNTSKIDAMLRLIDIYRELCQKDLYVVNQTMASMLKRFLLFPALDIEHELTEITYNMIYQRACNDLSPMEMLDSLRQWESCAGIKIQFYPKPLFSVYQALPYFHYSWGRKELEEVIEVRLQNTVTVP